MPSPKCPCQMRFAITRDGRGLRGSTIQLASSRRPLLVATGGSGAFEPRIAGTVRSHRIAQIVIIAAEEDLLIHGLAFFHGAGHRNFLRRHGALEFRSLRHQSAKLGLLFGASVAISLVFGTMSGPLCIDPRGVEERILIARGPAAGTGHLTRGRIAAAGPVCHQLRF